MFKNEKDIIEIVNRFCEKNNCSSDFFKVSPISKNSTGGKVERLYNTSKVKNKNAKFVIKYYYKLDLIVIWNYSVNQNMSYSYKTIREKLSNGIRYGDKGTGFHTKEQYYVFFDNGSKLNELLHLIFNPI